MIQAVQALEVKHVEVLSEVNRVLEDNHNKLNDLNDRIAVLEDSHGITRPEVENEESSNPTDDSTILERDDEEKLVCDEEPSADEGSSTSGAS